ncbi:TrmH family RNA methyltransferase [Tamlana crocina]|uniref:RNA methyltransferase n=1 Tax=Tamlana crocina TaxID=393006 RepID=A0ABX1DC83_9FLAO|nr:RNA methyltransferase [Tamlana crocina]NJX14917.1 RNA methyltransferase [Tamlana crocina]
MKEITSTNNSLVKQLVQLKDKSRERKKSGTFLIEGQREIELAIKGGYALETVLFCAELFPEEQLNNLLLNVELNGHTERSRSTVEYPITVIEISKEIYQKLAHRGTTEGILAVAKTKTHDVKDLVFNNESPLILVAEAPEKPGNIGALLRTADAANVDAVIIANPKTDLYNPNIIRSSVGCVFTTPIAMGTTDEIISFLQSNHINIYCAALQASVDYHTQDFTKPSAIVVGTEATGLSEAWRQHSTQNIIIPMQGEIDSMNVSVAAGILIFEAKRQRNFE